MSFFDHLVFCVANCHFPTRNYFFWMWHGNQCKSSCSMFIYYFFLKYELQNTKISSFQDEHNFMDTCGRILDSEIRIFIFIFYQLQFLKPFFFLHFDTELYRVVVRNLFECSGPVYNVWSSEHSFFKVKMI